MTHDELKEGCAAHGWDFVAESLGDMLFRRPDGRGIGFREIAVAGLTRELLDRSLTRLPRGEAQTA